MTSWWLPVSEKHEEGIELMSPKGSASSSTEKYNAETEAMIEMVFGWNYNNDWQDSQENPVKIVGLSKLWKKKGWMMVKRRMCVFLSERLRSSTCFQDMFGMKRAEG